MYVCMYVCMYVFMYVCMYVYMYVCMYVCTCMYVMYVYFKVWKYNFEMLTMWKLLFKNN